MIQTLFIGDLDGSPAEGTVRIEVKDRGRVPAELAARFKASSGK
jgi:hypothetical protein